MHREGLKGWSDNINDINPFTAIVVLIHFISWSNADHTYNLRQFLVFKDLHVFHQRCILGHD